MKHSFSVLSQICQRTTRRQSCTMSHLSQNCQTSPKSHKSHKTQNIFSKTVPHAPGSCQCITPPARCKKIFQKLSQPTSVFNQKNSILWSKTPKSSNNFFQKLSQTMKILFTLSKQTASVVSIILYSIIRNIAVRCSTNQKPSLQNFFKNCPTHLGVVYVLHRSRGVKSFFQKLSHTTHICCASCI